MIQHTKYMHLAETVANQSNCVRAKVGAVFVLGSVVAFGFNHNLDGTCECDLGLTKDNTIHAETHALDQQANWYGATGYITRRPCLPCAKQIYQKGVKTLYVKDVGSKQEGLRYLRRHNINVLESTWVQETVQQSWYERWL